MENLVGNVLCTQILTRTILHICNDIYIENPILVYVTSLETTQCNNVFPMNSIFTNESPNGCLDIIEHK